MPTLRAPPPAHAAARLRASTGCAPACRAGDPFRASEANAIVTLRRHLLARLGSNGWAGVLRQPWDGVAQACLAHWAAHQLPLVVTQQRAGLPAGSIALGLPAPLRWQRRRIALHVPLGEVLFFDDFPSAPAVVRLLPAARRVAWLGLAADLASLGAAPRVHGSFGWQRLTGLACVHADSDIDLRLIAADAEAADAIASRLARADWRGPRLDGELVFPDGSAVAWREWRQWRAREVDRILVKRLHGAAMEAGAQWPSERQAC